MFEITVYIQHRIYAQADSNRELYTEAAVKDSDNVCIGVAGFFYRATLRYASAGISCRRVSVVCACLSVTRGSIETAARIKLIFFAYRFPQPMLHYVSGKLGLSPEIRILPFGTYSKLWT